MKTVYWFWLSLGFGLALVLLQTLDAGPGDAPKPIHNLEAIVPPMCYTRTLGQFNPCYVCHQNHEGRPNTMADGDLQLSYAFSDIGETNHWENLFRDFSQEVARIKDAEIDRWVAQDNYSDLGARLEASGFEGYIPDLNDLNLGAQAFDERGLARDGSGWFAFNYKPLPSTFWPINGTADDVMLRLPEAFRRNGDGKPDDLIYLLNLTIVEAAVKDAARLPIPPVDETALQVDLNGDGRLEAGVGLLVKPKYYLGQASDIPVHRFLYPKGTEFLHSLRYLAVSDTGEVEAAPRMKELRYMRKYTFVSEASIRHRYYSEKREKNLGDLPEAVSLGDRGMDNGFGWEVMGFIENAEGHLRVQDREETTFCMGCHSTVGATIDQTFAFARKRPGVEGWGYIDLEKLYDAPMMGDDRGEVAAYFDRAGGSDEFRQHRGSDARWFNADGSVNQTAVTRATYAQLITPTAARARALNKAYRLIVAEQSFNKGRDAHVQPMRNVLEKVDPETAPTLPERAYVEGDLRLDWSKRPPN